MCSMEAMSSSGRLRVLLVEDNADTRCLIKMCLEQAGHEVHEAPNLHTALRDYPAWHCDVVLSDIGLPDGSGCELMRELRRTGELAYGIAMSGYGTSADIEASKEAGFSSHLIKPIELEELEQALEGARAAIMGPSLTEAQR